MKFLFSTYVTVLLLFALSNSTVIAFASEYGFSTESLSESEQKAILSNTEIAFLNCAPREMPIQCFDVDKNGIIAIGCSDSENKTICVYSDNGQFLYGYGFKCNGEFGVEFAENDLVIYFVRSNVAMAVNHMGEVVDIQEIQNTLENNTYWNNHVLSDSRKIGDTEYSLKNNLGILNVFASSYSQLIVREADGEERILYDVNSTYLLQMLFIFVVVLLSICFAVAVVAREFVKLQRGMKLS